MSSPPTPRVPVPLNQEIHLRLVSLCILLVAINEACKAKNHVSYSSGHTDHDSRLSDYQKFLCKLTQICDIQKGGDTVTALTVLKGPQGPNYLFTSNNRKPMEFDQARDFLSELLDTVGRNPNRMNAKPLKKHVLWRILEFNFPRLEQYLKFLGAAIEDCIEDCERLGELSSSGIIGRLRYLGAKAEFPRDITSSSNARDKCQPVSVSSPVYHPYTNNADTILVLCDCEILIKAIHESKADPITEQTIQKRIKEGDAAQSYSWCQLRHYLGRLQSYRRASEIICDALAKWPALFQNFTVNYIPSPRLSRVSFRGSPTSPAEVVRTAFDGLDSSEYDACITDLQRYRLDEGIREQLSSGSFRSRIHCEVHLHSDLVRQGKTQPADFWKSGMFIATSKPSCCLCHYYFQDPNNSDFQLQAPHMNLYMKWQLPNVYEDEGFEAVARREEVAEGIIEQMIEGTLKILKDKFPMWKTNDSRTDSRTGTSAARVYSRADHYHVRLRTLESGMERFSKTSDVYEGPFLSMEGDEEWVDVGTRGDDGDEIEMGGAAILTGVAR
ncbi:hypothetical protein ACJZ2D_013405 [Fusarium nematophilum]